MEQQEQQLSPIKQALLQQRVLKARIRELESAASEPIAIIGMACRFPGAATSPAALWRLLDANGVAISELPKDRFDIGELFDPSIDRPGKVTTRFAGTVRDIADFDARFFGLSPREALSMDPQQRMLLEVCWEALENAGLAPGRLISSLTGVFVGIATLDYMMLNSKHTELEDVDAYSSIGTAESVVPGRVSYLFGFKGPSLAVNTACSSSLVAVHLAAQSLRNRECRVALACGVNALLSAEHFVSLSKAGMLAPDGRCKTFDARADGFVRAEGCGVVALKRWSDAVADGDNLLAVIRGSAVNHDGRSNGLTAPNGPSQEAVIAAALRNAGVAAEHVGYVETHGTGTALGDPIEVQALANVLGVERTASTPVLLGSVKTNLGHMESAAGIGGLLKVVLALQHRKIPGHPLFESPNPHIPWAELPVQVVTAAREWPELGGTRIGGVSSFGFSGTNAHVVVEQAPCAESAVTSQPDRPFHLLCLSAKTPAALGQLAERYESLLAQNDAIALADLCFTANTGRDHFAHRRCIPAGSKDALRAGLAAGAAGAAFVERGVAEITFLFSGQGDLYPGVGRSLFATQPAFRDAIQRCNQLLSATPAGSLEELLNRADSRAVDDPALAQPMLFALQYALACMWQSWGVVPTAVCGHSVGEFAAACVAGILSLKDAIELVSARGRLCATMVDGAMAAVRAPLAAVVEVIGADGPVCVAARNGPENTVVSGPPAAVDVAIDAFTARGVRVERLRVRRAFHSPAADLILEEFRQVARTVDYRRPSIAFVSTVTGRAIAADEVDADYWCRHLRQPVLFEQAVQALRASRQGLFVEIGPGTTLVGMAAACDGAGDAQWLPSLKKGEGEWSRVLATTAALYLKGVSVDWHAFERGFARRRLQLPSYPFQRERFWPEWVHGSARSGRAPWTAAARAAAVQAAQAPIDLNLAAYGPLWSSLDRFTSAVVADTLLALGAFRRAGESQTADSLVARCGVVPTYRDLLDVWLSRLATAGLLERTGSSFAAVRALPAQDVAARLADVRSAAADIGPLVGYLERCAARIVPIMRGERSPIDTLFPDGSFDTAEFFYQRWSLARYFNSIVSRTVREFVGALQRRPVRVLEAGAGTGGTSSAVLSELPAGCEYFFTDLSDLFLRRAQDKFSAYGFARYGILDIGREPTAQGYPAHGFDVLIAANSLHATPALGATIEHARTLLTPGGLLVLYEVTQHLPWFEVSVALIEGWQLYNDDIRANHPLVTPPIWKRVLLERGFDEVMSFPEAGSPAEVLGHHVIVARASGAGERAALPVAASSAAVEHARAAPAARASAVDALHGLPAEDARDALVDLVRDEVMHVLRLGPNDRPQRSARLMDLGVDSLMAVELKKRLHDAIGGRHDLPATLIFDFPTIDAVAEHLQRLLGLGVGDARPPQPAEQSGRAEVARLEGLSEQELESLLLDKLGQL